MHPMAASLPIDVKMKILTYLPRSNVDFITHDYFWILYCRRNGGLIKKFQLLPDTVKAKIFCYLPSSQLTFIDEDNSFWDEWYYKSFNDSFHKFLDRNFPRVERYSYWT